MWLRKQVPKGKFIADRESEIILVMISSSKIGSASSQTVSSEIGKGGSKAQGPSTSEEEKEKGKERKKRRSFN